jgi:hypothetical protein
MKLEDVKVSDRELLDNLPIFGVHHLDEEKLVLFIEYMRENVRKRKFKDLQKRENGI